MMNFVTNSLGLDGKTLEVDLNDQRLILRCLYEAYVDYRVFVALEVLKSDVDEALEGDLFIKEVVRDENGNFNLSEVNNEIAETILDAITQNAGPVDYTLLN